jgi:predicted DNA-binding transcriptional regulator YafY
MERISSVVVLEQRFSPPLGSSLRKMLGHAWGIWTSDHPVEVVRELVRGGVELRLVIAEPTKIRPWILGWGKECEVVTPADLRDSIAYELEQATVAYETGRSLADVKVLQARRTRTNRVSRSIAG